MRTKITCSALSLAVLALTLAALVQPGAAQEAMNPAQEKWRPKDGIYAVPDKDFRSSCNDEDNITIDLGEKSVNGYEWGCSIRQVLELAPGSLKLEMTCNDYNLAQSAYPRDPNWENRRFKEVMLIKRLDAKTISMQKTVNGKFKDPAWRGAYCPKETQRSYAEAKVDAKEKARQKAGEERSLINAHPRDGVYAVSGSDFEERCWKFSDTIVAFARKSIFTASNSCRIQNTRVQLPDTVRIGATCELKPPSNSSNGDNQHASIPLEYENLMFKKIDDKTVILWIIDNGHFTGDGQKLSYCSDTVQRAYARQSRADKSVKNKGDGDRQCAAGDCPVRWPPPDDSKIVN